MSWNRCCGREVKVIKTRAAVERQPFLLGKFGEPYQYQRKYRIGIINGAKKP
jgi:hypothetical protein